MEEKFRAIDLLISEINNTKKHIYPDGMDKTFRINLYKLFGLVDGIKTEVELLKESIETGKE